MKRPLQLNALQLALLSSLAGSGLSAYAADSSTNNIVMLDPVNVYAEAISAKPLENWKTLSQNTSTDLKDMLKDQVAVNFGGGNGVSQWVTIRGMGDDQIDYVVDDTSSGDTRIFHHQGRFMLDPALMKVVGVEKGTGSASSGIGATSGKIEAVTVDASDLLQEGRDFGFRVNGGISSNKGHNTGVAVYGQQNGFDGLVMGNWGSYGNYKAGDGHTVTNSALGTRSFLGKVGYNINPEHRVVLSHRREEEYGKRNLREEFDFVAIGNAANNDPSYRHRINDVTNLAYSGKNMGFISSLDANIFSGRMKQDSAAGRRLPASTTTIKSSGGNFRFASKIGEHTLKYGLNHRYQKAERSNAMVGFDGQKKTDVGVYIEGIWNLHPVTLTTGLRYDHYKLDGGSNTSSGNNLNPSVGVIWDVNENLSFNASYNVASRSPRMREALLTASPIYLRDDLKAERSYNAEVGFNWTLNGFAFSGSYFRQTIKDLQNLQNINGQYVSFSKGTLKNHGYELNAAYRWEGLKARIGVAHSKPSLDGATYDSVSTTIPMGRQWTTGLSYRFDNPNLEIGWNGRYAERGQYIPATRGSGGNSATPISRAGYGVHDIYANWQPTGKDNLNVNFAISNVGNKNYRTQSQRSGGAALPEPGREYRLNVNYRF